MENLKVEVELIANNLINKNGIGDLIDDSIIHIQQNIEKSAQSGDFSDLYRNTSLLKIYVDLTIKMDLLKNIEEKIKNDNWPKKEVNLLNNSLEFLYKSTSDDYKKHYITIL